MTPTKIIQKLFFYSFFLLLGPAVSDAIEGEGAKFHTNTEGFGKTYAKLAHHQAKFNEEIIKKLSSTIQRWFPHTDQAPLSILDLCCGHGKPTIDLLRALKREGVCIAQMTGYDISPAQIEQATSLYKEEPRVKFGVKNAEALDEEKRYDIIYSLFGLHWMENLPQVAKGIARALKPGGKVMFFVPLEKKNFFEVRQAFIHQPMWQSHFKDYRLAPFIETAATYLTAFAPYMQPELPYTCAGFSSFNYPEDKMVTFLSSWMQEGHHLRSIGQGEEVVRAYIKGLLETVPKAPERGEVVKLDSGDYAFTEFYFQYHGELRPQLEGPAGGMKPLEASAQSREGGEPSKNQIF